jgi:DNA-binding transcriptional MerR regulator
MLKDEHADITISKIRFFESQGLINPERTPSGYRKFYDHDIDRLRWILVQQRDNFLPLKVIKRRLEEAGFDPASAGNPPDSPLPEPTLFTKPSDGGDTAPPGAKAEAVSAPPDPDPDPGADPEPVDDQTPEPEPEPEPDPGPVAAEVPAAPPVADGDPLDVPAGSVSLSALELAEAAGVDLGLIADLERLGLIETVAAGDTVVFDHEAMVVARAAGVFKARGVEPRHLRMFKVAADRQTGLLEQLVSPHLKKGGESQRVARAELNELVQLGESIQRSILRRSFGNQLD